MTTEQYAALTWAKVPIEERQRRVLHNYRDRLRRLGIMPEPMSEAAKTTYWKAEQQYHARLRRARKTILRMQAIRS
jgi:hypothetical protein